MNKFIVFSLLILLLSCDLEKSKASYVTKLEIIGIVNLKCFDKNNHKLPTLRIGSIEHASVWYSFPNSFSKIEIGDSLYKLKGDTVLRIFRNNIKIDEITRVRSRVNCEECRISIPFLIPDSLECE